MNLTQKTIFCIIPFYEVAKQKKNMLLEVRQVVALDGLSVALSVLIIFCFLISVWLRECVFIMKSQVIHLLNWHFYIEVSYISRKLEKFDPTLFNWGSIFDFFIYSHQSLSSSFVLWPPGILILCFLLLWPEISISPESSNFSRSQNKSAKHANCY